MITEVLKEMAAERVCGLIDNTDSPNRENENSFVSCEGNVLRITLQDGPIKEVGENGAQIDILAELLKEIVTRFQTKHFSPENVLIIDGLKATLGAFTLRTARRTKDGTEGTNEK